MLNLDEFNEEYFRSLPPKMAFEYYGIFLKRELEKEHPKFPIIKNHIFLQKKSTPIQLEFDLESDE
ncbi:MAG TPA: hypothetical protein PLD77_02730 [Candidatus Dojkabacteria bacterium]|nr:hypothetical protein [Candidatus Dojkabacteria bacterium]